jgi:hypothetical protein
MTHATRPFAALVLTAAVGLSACGSSATPPITPSATLQPIAGSTSGRIVLTALGAQRIGLQTAVVRSVPPPPPPPPPAPPAPTPAAGATTPTAAAPKVTTPKPATPVVGPTVIIPYSSVIYAPNGSTFAFTSSSPLSFTETPVTIDHIDGSSVYLTKGPGAGTKVVTTGAEELFGVQTGVLPQT